MEYLSGFNNHLSTEAIPGALPKGQNSPQKSPLGLYAEQISGTSFLVPRNENRKSWLYRILPSVSHTPFRKISKKDFLSWPMETSAIAPDQMRWDPLPLPSRPTDFLSGIFTVAGNGDVAAQKGSAIHVFAINKNREETFFYNADGEMLFVPQKGQIQFLTEFGTLDISPGEIAVIPRGVRFQVKISSESARGYLCENYGALFRLPELGPIGANGLANPRDFLVPCASYEDKTGPFRLVAKFQGQLWEADLAHSPLNVVAWNGNYYPYKYSLDNFQVINTVSFDHPDPSIFTVLTSPTERTGVSNVDFVIFPPRWMVAEHTFRPPYFHRNCMSEWMGLIRGTYDAKPHSFEPGGFSLHNCMSGHGPDAESFQKASRCELKPQYMKNTLAIMFESALVYQPTAFALNSPCLQKNYLNCWSGLKSHFRKDEKDGSKSKQNNLGRNLAKNKQR